MSSSCGLCSGGMTRGVFRPAEVAAQLGVATCTIYDWIRSGKIRAVRVAHSLFVHASDLARLLEGRDAHGGTE